MLSNENRLRWPEPSDSRNTIYTHSFLNERRPEELVQFGVRVEAGVWGKRQVPPCSEHLSSDLLCIQHPRTHSNWKSWPCQLSWPKPRSPYFFPKAQQPQGLAFPDLVTVHVLLIVCWQGLDPSLLGLPVHWKRTGASMCSTYPVPPYRSHASNHSFQPAFPIGSLERNLWGALFEITAVDTVINMKFTPINCKIQWFLIVSAVQSLPLSNFRTLFTQTETIWAYLLTLPFSP